MTLHGIQLGNRPHEYLVPSEQDPMLIYHVYMDLQKCTCKGYLTHKSCKHLELWVPQYIAEMNGAREPGEEAPEKEEEEVTGMIIPPPATVPSKWIVTIHGKESIRYQGLLAMAHEQGLIHFGARFTEVTDQLATAWAWAHFKDGRKFYEAAEATPENVQPGVKKAWMRMALTRAKARVLRDALNIGMVSTEELEE